MHQNTGDQKLQIKEPPTTIWGMLSNLGPSMILSASIVGSGELIMTTTLGAQAGFVALWIIVLSCLVKVCVQLEFGKHAIYSGETAITSLNRLPGLKIFRIHWSIWIWFIVQLVIVLQYGGIADAISQAGGVALPALPAWSWIVAAGLTTALLVAIGYYELIQGVSVGLIAIFTFFTIVCVAMLHSTPFSITTSDLVEGFSFQLPRAALGAAVAAFGLTGVGATEIITYPYWCLEKGYAAFTGPFEKTEEWTNRAKGWIRVMYWDSVLSMVIYTVVTMAFYVLGAAVLHGQGEVPGGVGMILTLSEIYTETAGSQVMMLYIIGAIVVLYSTLFSGTAAWTRLFSDFWAQIENVDYNDANNWKKKIAILGIGIPIAWTVTGLLMTEIPVVLVMAGGIANAILLFVVIYAAFIFRYKYLTESLKPTVIYDIILWISFISIAGVGILALSKLF
ncbi:MAG: divalent metal cation transporter [Calditrichaeota bacterium]|nr:MAG: divalent metal cation transporter [Calditrichota bacterium]